MTNFKRVKLVMLPSNEKAENCLVILSNGKLAYHKGYITQEYLHNVHSSSHHLYFLSENKPQFNDWYFSERHQKPIQILDIGGIQIIGRNSKKIIATTDTSLGLPTPSKEFIDVFISEYNKGSVIEFVMVEYETNGNWESEKSSGYAGRRCVNCDTWNYIEAKYECACGMSPKTDKANNITIRKIKDSWNKEEVIVLIHLISGTMYKEKVIYSPERVNQWISNNL